MKITVRISNLPVQTIRPLLVKKGWSCNKKGEAIEISSFWRLCGLLQPEWENSRGRVIRAEAESGLPAARKRRCSRRWRRVERWQRKRRGPTMSTACATTPRSCAGWAGPCWYPPRHPTDGPWSSAAALTTAAAARSAATRLGPLLNSLQQRKWIY